MKKDILRRAFLWVLAVLMLTGIAMPAALAEEEPCTLWLVTEESTSAGMNAAITAEAAQFEEEHPGVSIKIDILPNQKNERAEYLEALREKMRNGEGPDIFMLPTRTVLALDGITYRRIEALFPDVAHEMESGTFADVSSFYDQDTALDKGALNQSIMNAGTRDGARYVLPLRFSAQVIFAFEELLADSNISEASLTRNIDGMMQIALDTKNKTLAACADVSSMPTVFSGFASDDIPAPDTQQVASYMKRYQALRAMRGAEEIESSGRFDFLLYHNEPFPAAYNDLLCDGLNFLAASKKTDATLLTYPQRTTRGDTVAYVVYYGAVSSSCKAPETAYEFLRRFLMEDAVGDNEQTLLHGEWRLSPLESSWPVRTTGSVAALWEKVADKLSDGKLKDVQLNDADFPVMETQFDIVYFPVRNKAAAILSQLNDANNNYAATDVDIDALANDLIASLAKNTNQ